MNLKDEVFEECYNEMVEFLEKNRKYNPFEKEMKPLKEMSSTEAYEFGKQVIISQALSYFDDESDEEE